MFFLSDRATSDIYTLSLHDALPILTRDRKANGEWGKPRPARVTGSDLRNLEDGDERAILERLAGPRSEEHTSELQSLRHLVCRLLLEKKKESERARTGTAATAAAWT